MQRNLKLLVTDIDNTIFDWVGYYVHACEAMLFWVGNKINVPYGILADEARSVFTKHGSIEYPFLVQELPSALAFYGSDLDGLLKDLVEPARQEFLRVGLPLLKPYQDVVATLEEIKLRFPMTPVVALTDAPRYVAMWKLNKLGVLPYFSAVYGLADPRLPTDSKLGRVKVDARILLKHLEQSNFGFHGKVRILPDEYEKPGTRGLKTVLMDYEVDEDPDAKKQTVWVGDNLRKDIGLGTKVGIKSCWAKYGTQFDPDWLRRLHAFSPIENVVKNVALDHQNSTSPVSHVTLETFSDLLKFL